MEEKSLQMELKIARRDDVIEFPLLINPLIHIHRNTRAHTLKDTDTQRYKQRRVCTHCKQLYWGGRHLGGRAERQGSLVSVSMSV